MTEETLLIPVEFPDPMALPSTFVSGFTDCRVLLVGVYETPDDIDPDERQRREIEAYNTLYSYANQFVRAGDVAEVELVMGEDVADAPSRIAEERDVDALLVPNPITALDDVLISVRDPEFVDPIGRFVGMLDEDVLLHSTLFSAAESEAAVEEKRGLLGELEDRMVEAGFNRTTIDAEVAVSDDPPFAISEAARDHDLIIMGETQDSEFERVFGATYQSIADETDHPIVVVRK
ncbi:universal stress protein [Halobium salinum]|uniref:Universal stress protein n=1 Tax=Halobium salinum TaxID=1364940 RepID=A0ABD5PBM9_9EURY|nr:universal stress protein [Halobium salinum]